MANLYECSNCGVITEDRGHLCSPREVAQKSEYCGQPMQTAGTMCRPESEEVDYECAQCGRPVEDPKLVCKPTKIQ